VDPYKLQQQILQALIASLIEELRRYGDNPFAKALLKSLTSLMPPPQQSTCLVDTYADGSSVVIIAEGDAYFQGGIIVFSTPCGMFSLKKPGTVRNVRIENKGNMSIVRLEL